MSYQENIGARSSFRADTTTCCAMTQATTINCALVSACQVIRRDEVAAARSCTAGRNRDQFCHGRNARSGIHQPGQTMPMNNPIPKKRTPAAAPIIKRYRSLRTKAAVTTRASIAMVPNDARTARNGWWASCSPQATGALAESLTMWYLIVPFRIQVVHPVGTVSFAHAAAAKQTPNVSTGTQTV